ncbi:MAG: F0F1 ATP synthase subunit B [Planctomycetes bacterium]|nr:F0F1 ATP synthase subunit B [Planctomycetota bacterium]
MRSRTRFTLMTTLALAATHASTVLAAEEGGAHAELLAKPEQMWPAIIGALVMFVALVILLTKTAWKPILNGLQARETKIRTEIESAENARTQANAALETYQKELAKARAEANEMIAQAKNDAQRVADELRSKNEVELTAMKDRAKSDIEAAKRAALTELYAQTANLATAVAGKILQREINDQDRSQLVEESLRELGSLKGGGTSHN